MLGRLKRLKDLNFMVVMQDRSTVRLRDEIRQV